MWQDFVNGGSNYKLSVVTLPLITRHHIKDNQYKKFAREEIKGRIEALNEFKNTIDYLYNAPCIALWTIFNEGWGQFDSKKVYDELVKIDNARLYDTASGWHDQKFSEIKSYHVYFTGFHFLKTRKRATILSEFGGLVYTIEGHHMDGNHVYTKYRTKEKFIKAYLKLINRDVIKQINRGLTASIYTQLSDVEEEENGFVTFDREVIKVDTDIIKNINDKINLD